MTDANTVYFLKKQALSITFILSRSSKYLASRLHWETSQPAITETFTEMLIYVCCPNKNKWDEKYPRSQNGSRMLTIKPNCIHFILFLSYSETHPTIVVPVSRLHRRTISCLSWSWKHIRFIRMLMVLALLVQGKNECRLHNPKWLTY